MVHTQTSSIESGCKLSEDTWEGYSLRSRDFLTVIDDGHCGRSATHTVVIRTAHYHREALVRLRNEVIDDLNSDALFRVGSTEGQVYPGWDIVISGWKKKWCKSQ